MATNINSVILAGRLARDLEVKAVNGKTLAKFSIASSDDFKERKSVYFFDCIVWGSLADNMAKYVGKGCRVTVQGKLQQQLWTDKEGKKHQSVQVVVYQVEFHDFKNKKEANGNQAPSSQSETQGVEFPDFGDEQPQHTGGTDVPF